MDGQQQAVSDLRNEVRQSTQADGTHVAEVAVQHFDKHVDGLERDKLVVVLGDNHDEVQARISVHRAWQASVSLPKRRAVGIPIERVVLTACRRSSCP
jgi:hypothetical protein